MRNIVYNKPQVVKYLLWTFVLAYILQVGVGLLSKSENTKLVQLMIVGIMFVPSIGVLLSGSQLSDIGCKPQIKRNIKSILIAWFTPAIFTLVGALLYFLIFPGHFDLTGDYIILVAGKEFLEQMEAQGITYSMYVLIAAIGSVTYAPIINTLAALGEEIGWRGFLYPQLKAKFGRKKGCLLGGIIWGAWHWPLIWLIGFEYGAAAGNSIGYIGFPVSGMLIFCVFTVSVGILSDMLYEKSGSIWTPSIFHGAINAAATIPLTICIPNTGSARLLGPAPVGIIAGLPLLAVAVVWLFRRKINIG